MNIKICCPFNCKNAPSADTNLNPHVYHCPHCHAKWFYEASAPHTTRVLDSGHAPFSDMTTSDWDALNAFLAQPQP